MGREGWKNTQMCSHSLRGNVRNKPEKDRSLAEDALNRVWKVSSGGSQDQRPQAGCLLFCSGCHSKHGVRYSAVWILINCQERIVEG